MSPFVTDGALVRVWIAGDTRQLQRPPACPRLAQVAALIARVMDWEGAGDIVSCAQLIAVRNPVTGQVSQRRQIDFTMPPWIPLTKI